MRLNELTGKEIVNIGDGMRLGVIDRCELAFDEKTGRIHSLLLPPRSAFTGFFQSSKAVAVFWKDVRKIGEEVIIVDVK